MVDNMKLWILIGAIAAIVLIIILLKVVKMSLFYAVPIGIGIPTLILFAIYAIKHNNADK